MNQQQTKVLPIAAKIALAVIIAALMAVAYTPLMMMLFTGLFITAPFSIATVCLAAIEVLGVWSIMQLVSPNKAQEVIK